LYITPLYLTGGAVCLLVMAVTGEPFLPDPSQWKWVIALTLIPTIIGHGLLNYAMKHTRGQVVAVASQTQFIFAGTAAYFVFGTVPALTFYPSCLLAIVGTGFILLRKR
ncbi:MAG: EamA family transporter, partial [Verrucomicrobiales bacterium]